MTRLSSWVLCSKWFSPPEKFFAMFPKQFFTLVSQSPAVFRQMAVASERFCRGFRQLCFTFISQSPRGVQAAWLVWHVSPIPIQSAENYPSCHCCWGSPIALQNRTVIVWPGKRWRWSKRSELPTLCDGSVMCPAGNPAGAIIIALHQR